MMLSVLRLLLLAGSVSSQGIWTPQGCRVDLCFIMDESGSIGRNDWEVSKEFVANFTGMLAISPQASQAGVVKFDSFAELEIELNKHSSKGSLTAEILRMSYSGGGTSIHDGLRVARQRCFDETNGDRIDAPNIAVLMTDGQSSESHAIREAELLRATGATIIAIGIGRGIDEDLLRSIANDDDNVFFVKDFDTLYENVNTILGKSCEASQNCAGGQLDGWNGSYPMLLDCPHLYNPIVEANTFVKFLCGLNYSSNGHKADEARFRVSFLFDGQEYTDVPVQVVTPPIELVSLHEKYLHGKMGKYISCRVQTFFNSTPTLRSPTVISRSYWAGISYSHELVNVFENDDGPRTILAYSTIPITCSANTDDCELPLDIVSEQSIAVFQNQDGLIRTCTYVFYDYNWVTNESIAAGHPLQIMARRDPIFGELRRATVMVKARNLEDKYDPSLPETDRHYTNPWNGYSSGNITIHVHDSMDGPGTCRSTGDPRITTFDGRLYSAQQIGCFTYVQSTSSRDFEVHVQHYGCSPGSTACAIACGVAVREGPEIQILSVCPDPQLHILNCCGYNSSVITVDEARRNYMITTPGGARVKVTLLNRGMNVYIDVPARDSGKTSGLCGTYDGNPNNDYEMKDGTLATNVNTFIESWRNRFPCLLGCNCSSPEPPLTTYNPTTQTVPHITTINTAKPYTSMAPVETNMYTTATSKSTTEATFTTVTLPQTTTAKCQGNSWKCRCSPPNDPCEIKCRERFCKKCARDPSKPFCCDPPEHPRDCPKPNTRTDDNFCHCVDEGDKGSEFVNATTCGLPALEDPLGDVTNPRELILALIPGFLKGNALPPRKSQVSSYCSSDEDEWCTDLIDDEYKLVYIPETYTGDDNPPPWGTFGITEVEASDHCKRVLQNSQSHSTCSGTISEHSVDIIVQKCIMDVQRTGDLKWADDKVFEYQDQCMQTIFKHTDISDREDPLSDPVFAQNIGTFINNSCPDDCSGHGRCQAKICHCDDEYVGATCSVRRGVQPIINKYIGPDVCDIRERPCHSVKVIADRLVNSENITCQIHIHQMNGTSYEYTYDGQMITSSTLQCPLPDLLALQEDWSSNETGSAYLYRVSVSNDGLVFPPTAVDQTRLVVDSLCTCRNHGRCFHLGEKRDHCYVCFPESEKSQWAVDPTLPKPLMSSGTLYMKVPEEELSLNLQAFDPLGQSVEFNLLSETEIDIVLHQNGTLHWRDTNSTRHSKALAVGMAAIGDCPRNNDVVINLVTTPCETFCGPGGRCIPKPSLPVGQGHYTCDCAAGLYGESCQFDLDECSSSPCIHGVCVDDVNEYRCSCQGEYTGTHCESAIGLTGEWTEFGACSKECDYGIRTRSRPCLAAPCHPSDLTYTVLCNDFNCLEMDGEMQEGSILIVGSSILQVVMDEPAILNLTLDVLNSHCQSHPIECCMSMGFHIPSDIPPSPHYVFSFGDIRSASGYPNVDNEDRTRLKIIAGSTRSVLSEFCRSATHVQKRIKRLVRESWVMVDKQFLDGAMKENMFRFIEQFGYNIEVPSDVVDVKGSSELKWLAIPVSVAAVLLFIVLPILVWRIVRKREAPDETDKQRILQDENESSVKDGREKSTPVNLFPPMDTRMTQRAPSVLSMNQSRAELIEMQTGKPRSAPPKADEQSVYQDGRPGSASSNRNIRRPSSSHSRRSALVYPDFEGTID